MIEIHRSKGVKRKIAALLAVIATLATLFPQTSCIVPWLVYGGAGVGVAGLADATHKKTVLAHRLGSLAALAVIFWAVALQTPVLALHLSLIITLASLLGAAAISQK